MKMLSGVAVVLLLCAVAVQGNDSQVRCHWARILKNSGMHNFAGVSLADWVCLIKHESGFNTAARNRNNDGSTDYGLFQINSKYWCHDGGVSVANGCGIECSALFNPAASINCAKRVVRDPNGVRAWVAWQRHCQGKDLRHYISDCGV